MDNTKTQNISEKRLIDITADEQAAIFKNAISEMFANTFDIANPKNNLNSKDEILTFLGIKESQFRKNCLNGVYGNSVAHKGGKYYLNVPLFYMQNLNLCLTR